MNDLISDEYLALQREMHKDASYGTSGRRYATDVVAVATLHGCKTILDYGCGKGTLKRDISLDYDDLEVREFDPCIEGKDADPEPADLVVCTDVLEHVEEDRLEAVLESIRQKSMIATYFSIATTPAKKSLPDGRNAHITLHDSDWWVERLQTRFSIEETRLTPTGVILACRPYRLVGDIVTVAAVDDEDRFENVRQNIGLTDKRLKIEPPHNRVAILCCYGPSLRDTYRDVVREKNMLDQNEGGDIVTVSGAHDFLIERGIRPDLHIEVDPRKHKGEMTKHLNPHTKYLYATCCHPEVVKRIADTYHDNLILWHLDSGEPAQRIGRELEPNALLISGGGSVGLRAIGVLVTIGYRRFVIHGMDCSYADDATTHAAAHSGKPQVPIEAICYGRKFWTSPIHMAYLKQFDDMRNQIVGEPPDKVEIVLRGDGMLQWAVRNTPGASEAA